MIELEKKEKFRINWNTKQTGMNEWWVWVSGIKSAKVEIMKKVLFKIQIMCNAAENKSLQEM